MDALKRVVDYILHKSGRICDFAYYTMQYERSKRTPAQKMARWSAESKILHKIRDKFWCGRCVECIRRKYICGSVFISAVEHSALKALLEKAGDIDALLAADKKGKSEVVEELV